MDDSIGCELSASAANDLRKAIKCLLTAGFLGYVLTNGSTTAQQMPDGAPPTDQPRVTAVYVDVPLIFTRWSQGAYSPHGYSMYLDGVRVASSFLGGNDTEGYDQPEPQPPKVQRNPEPSTDDTCKKEKGDSSSVATVVGNPVDIVDGYKHVSAIDFQSISAPQLRLERYKNPRWKGEGILGQGWVTNLDVKLAFSDDNGACYPAPGKPSCNMPNPKLINFFTDRGGIIQLASSGGIWTSSGTTSQFRITKDSAGRFILTSKNSLFSPRYVFRPDGFAETIDFRNGHRLEFTYDSNNRLTRATHNSGRSIIVAWNSATPHAAASITDPNGGVYRLSYYTIGTNYSSGSSAPILRSVAYPDGKGEIEYVQETGHHTVFGDPRPYTALHRLLEVKVNGTSYKKYTYDLFQNNTSAVISSAFADGSGLVQYSYNKTGTRQVTNPYGRTTTYTLDENLRITGVAGSATPNCPSSFREAEYYDNGLKRRLVDNRGTATTFAYDSLGRKTVMTEAVGTASQRVTRWYYDSDLSDVYRTDSLSKVITDGVLETSYAYRTQDINGPLLYSSITQRDLTGKGLTGGRTTTYSYTFHANGLIASVVKDGPVPGSGDQEISRYSANGDLISVENGLGHRRTFSGHNGFGQPSKVVYENGSVRLYEYDARGRIVSDARIVNGQEVQTRFVYDSWGRLSKVVAPTGLSLTKEYDVAGRLIREYRDEPGGTFAVRLNAYDVDSNLISTVVQRTTAVFKPTAVPTLTVAGSAPGSFTVSWTGSNGAETYALDQSIDGGSWSRVSNTAGLSKPFSDMAAGRYSYRVRACNAQGCTSYSASKDIEVVLPPSSPELTSPSTSTNGNFTVSWGVVSGADIYRLERRVDDSSWSSAYVGGATSKVFSALANGSYQFRVRACNDVGCSAYSAVRTTVILHPPGVPILTVPSISSTGSFIATWGAASTATRYDLVQRASGGAWTVAYSGSGRSKAIGGLAEGAYEFKVRACNSSGCGSYSSGSTVQVVFPPTAAPTITVPPLGRANHQFTVSWTSVARAATYSLEERYVHAAPTPWTDGYSGPSLSMSEAFTFGAQVEYRVRACNLGGCGPYSSTGKIWIAPPPAHCGEILCNSLK